jgi:hypothetical protein
VPSPVARYFLPRRRRHRTGEQTWKRLRRTSRQCRSCQSRAVEERYSPKLGLVVPADPAINGHQSPTNARKRRPKLFRPYPEGGGGHTACLSNEPGRKPGGMKSLLEPTDRLRFARSYLGGTWSHRRACRKLVRKIIFETAPHALTASLKATAASQRLAPEAYSAS